MDMGPAAGPRRSVWISRDQQVTNLAKSALWCGLWWGERFAVAPSVSVSELVGSAVGEQSAVADSAR